MQSFEKPRYEKAANDFQNAFEAGYTRGLKALEDGTERNPNVESVFFVDVPRNPVLDGNGAAHADEFEVAGYMAAIARRRTGTSVLDATESDPDGSHANTHNALRWVVLLNPPVR